jgi:hypothetical protein
MKQKLINRTMMFVDPHASNALGMAGPFTYYSAFGTGCLS